MESPIITPFRWYDKFYNQNRYDVDCKTVCEFKLITDKGHLLPFQFTRAASILPIDSWILRKSCIDPELASDITDIVLDASLILLLNFGTIDYFIYKGNLLGISLPTGEYFSIIKSGSDIFYSEMITVKDFQPDKAPFYTLKWTNTCDIQDAIYQIGYFNMLYLEDAVITKPEYPFKEEGEEDGNKNFIATVQLWEKKVNFIIARVHEFISDSLYLIQEHDTITITPPARNEQIQACTAVSIQSVESEISYIINDCFQTVNLKMLIEDKYIDYSCCENNIVNECATIVEGTPSGHVTWGTGAFHFNGVAYHNSFMQVWYSLDSGATWIADPQIVNDTIYNIFGIDIVYPEIYDGSSIYFKLHNWSVSCEYGYTDIEIYTFAGECEVRTIDTGANRTLSDGTFRTLSPC